MQTYLKTIIAALSLLTLIGLSYLGYAYWRDRVAFSSDPNLAELERYEQAKDYPGLANALFRKREGTAFSEAVLPWLEKREERAFAPYLYAQALHLNVLQKPEEAIRYYFRAGLLARIDLLYCLDASAEKLIMQMESLFPDTLDYLDEHPGARVSAGTLALLKEEQAVGRPKPDWLCPYGDKKLSKYEAFVEETLWLERRIPTLESFRILISERPAYPEGQ